MKQVWILLRPYHRTFALGLVALLLSSFFGIALTALAEPLLNQVLGTSDGNANSEEILFPFKDTMATLSAYLGKLGIEIGGNGLGMSALSWSIIALVVFIGEACFEFLGTYLLGRIGLLVVVNLRQQIIDHVSNLSLRFFGTFNSGEVLTRISSDVSRLQLAISSKLGELFKEATRILLGVVLAFVIDWKLSLTLFLLVPMVGIPISIFTRKIRKYAGQSQNYLGTMVAHFKEVLSGIRIVKGFQREAFESRKLAEQNRRFLHYAIKELRIISMTGPAMGVMGMIFILGFIIYGSISIKNGTLSSGGFLFYVLNIYGLYQPLKRVTRANSEIQQAVGVFPRIQELLSFQNEILEPATPKRFPGYPVISEIEYQQVSFAYAREDGLPVPVLNDINLRLNSGSAVALVGPSGGGKSSMVNLLARFYDVTGGSIRINGLDIREMSTADLRALFAIVTQDTVLFDDTVFNNIAYGDETPDAERVERAATQAFALGFIQAMPDGFATMIGENGTNLSGGQRQRISIARAIYKNAPFLILDEATSALDSESEKEVQMALDNLMKSKTTFVIAHRLSTIRRADQIVVLEAGRIVEQGTHNELIQQKGLYRKLIEMQGEVSCYTA